MNRTRWKYKYDADGNRVGLIEVDDTPDDDDMGYTATRAMEDDMDAKLTLSRWRAMLTPREQSVAKAERRVMQAPSTKGRPNLSAKEVVRETWYRTATYKFKSEEITVTVADMAWIVKEIQKTTQSWGVKHMSIADIYDVLSTVTDVYMACDAIDGSVPMVDIGQARREKLRKAG